MTLTESMWSYVAAYVHVDLKFLICIYIKIFDFFVIL